MLKNLSKRLYTTSRQIGSSLQISETGHLALPVKGCNVVYKLNLEESVQNMCDSIKQNSYDKIKNMEVKTDKETVKDLI